MDGTVFKLEASIGWPEAKIIIIWLVELGFSVDATWKSNMWKIEGNK